MKELLALNHGIDPTKVEEKQTILLPAGKLSSRDKEILSGAPQLSPPWGHQPRSRKGWGAGTNCMSAVKGTGMPQYMHVAALPLPLIPRPCRSFPVGFSRCLKGRCHARRHRPAHIPDVPSAERGEH